MEADATVPLMKRARAFCFLAVALVICQDAFAVIPCWPLKKPAVVHRETPKECHLAPGPICPSTHSELPHAAGTDACIVTARRLDRVGSIHNLKVDVLASPAGSFVMFFSELSVRSDSLR